MQKMKAIDRLIQYLDIKGIKPTRFEKNIGLSNGYLGTQRKRNADLGEGVLIKIIDNCLDISVEWLLTGNGQMLKNQVLKSEKEGGGLVTQQMIDKITEQAEEIARLKIEIEEYKKTISSLKDRIEVVPDAKCAIAG